MAETVVMTLTEFLLARIAEDEDWARAAEVGKPFDPIEWPTEGEPNDPAHILAECEAKRRLLTDPTFTYGQRTSGEPSIFAQRVMTYLALPYADHEDFRDEWRLDVSAAPLAPLTTNETRED